MKQRLDEIQQKAVTHGEGPLLVTAGPGSGKTTVITHHIKFLIDYLGVPPKEILVITFTKSAATEMKERFMRLCDIRNTEVVFGTFHAFFYQILRRSAGFQHDSLLKEKEKYTILRDILRDKKIHFYENTYLEDLLGEISQANNQNSIDKFESALVDQEIFKEVYFEYKRRKSGLHKIDFDDMVTECLSLLRCDRNILQKWQKSFRYILVDEFQDINPMQYEIVKMLAEPHHNIFAVGDEDQSVYSFRGANPKICFSFMEDYPEAKQIFLSVNYRCHKDIVEASKSLISHNRHRFKKEIKAFDCKECNYGKPQMNLPGSSVERSINKNNVKANGIEIKQFQYEQEAYEEIAKELNEKKEDIVCALEAISEPVSLYDPVYSDSEDSIYVIDQIRDVSSDDEAWIEDIAIKEAIKKLNDREKKIINMRFYAGKTQSEIASEIGISQAQVSRLEKGALERIRKQLV